MKKRPEREVVKLKPNTVRFELAEDLKAIRTGFTEYLRNLNYASCTIEVYQRMMLRVAAWIGDHPGQPTLRQFTRWDLPRLLSCLLPQHRLETRKNYRKCLSHWLRFQGRFNKPVRQPWRNWLSDYLDFLQTHQGVSRSTLDLNEANAKSFMMWQFGNIEADWTDVSPKDIWSYARNFVQDLSPVSAKSGLGYLRRFLRFVHLKGACGPQLANSVPKIAITRRAPRPEILSDHQRRRLLQSLLKKSPMSKRDYAMVLLMIDLGLRCGEVIGLELNDIDWQNRQLGIRKTKTGRGRVLPIPNLVFEALRAYVNGARPITGNTHVFVRHLRRIGYPLTRSAIKAIVGRAYRHCGFPPRWSGTHRLRHTFASRLHRRGVDMKPIADLLGHRRFDSTNTYTQVDWLALRAVARPWPHQS